MNHPQNNCYEEDEIDLRELLKILLRYKKTIFSITFIVIVLATLYVFLTTPIYKIQADIQTGYIINNSNAEENKKIYLLDPYALKIYILNNFNYSKEQQKSLPKVTVSVLKGTKDILHICIQDYSNKKAQEYLQKIIEQIHKNEKKKLNSYIANITTRIAILKKQKSKYNRRLQV